MSEQYVDGSVIKEIVDARIAQYIPGSFTNTRVRQDIEILAIQQFLSEMDAFILLMHMNEWIKLVKEEMEKIENILLEEESEQLLLLAEMFNKEAQKIEARRLALFNELNLIEQIIKSDLIELNKEYVFFSKVIDNLTSKIDSHNEVIVNQITQLSELYAENVTDLLNQELDDLSLDLSTFYIPKDLMKNENNIEIQVDFRNILEDFQDTTVDRDFYSDQHIMNLLNEKLNLMVANKFVDPHSTEARSIIEVINLSKQFEHLSKHIFDRFQNNFTEEKSNKALAIKSALRENIKHVKIYSENREQFSAYRDLIGAEVKNRQLQLDKISELKNFLDKPKVAFAGNTTNLFKKLNITESFVQSTKADSPKVTTTMDSNASENNKNIKPTTSAKLTSIFDDATPDPNNLGARRRR